MPKTPIITAKNKKEVFSLPVSPNEYKKMSVSELEKEKERLLQEIYSKERPKKQIKTNKRNIIFNF